MGKVSADVRLVFYCEWIRIILKMGKQLMASASALINAANPWQSIDWQRAQRTVRNLQIRIAKAVKVQLLGCPIRVSFRMLEPCAVKVACTVLRGEWSRKAPDLPDVRHDVV